MPRKSSVLSPPATTSTILSNGNKLNGKCDKVEHSNLTTAFGQQCSPNCGCVIRFEAKYDPNGSNRIQSMTYDAKTIMSTVSSHNTDKDGGGSSEQSRRLNPVYTTSAKNGRNGKLMMKECKCQTVHSLARTITERVPKMTLSQAQNQLDFLGVRSSPAFRYSVLKNHKLLPKEETNSNHDQSNNKNVEEAIINVKGGHCFDLIEDALVACLNGYMPKPRQTPILSSSDIRSRIIRDEPIKSHDRFMEQKRDGGDGTHSDDDPGLDPLRFVNAAKKRTAGLFFKSNSRGRNSSATMQSSSMPPFHLMNSHDEVSNDTLSQLKLEIKSLQRQQQEKEKYDYNHNSSMDDWLSYIDETDNSEGI